MYEWGTVSFYKMGNFPIMTLAAKLMYKLCIIYAIRKINIQHLENHWKMIQLNSKWITLIKCDLRAKVLEFVQFTMYKVFLHKCIFFFVFCSSHFFSVSQKDKHKTNWSAVHITENAPWMWYFFMILYHLQLFTQTISSMESRLE